VDGIRILRIERYTENGRTGTRMLINEAGEDRWVELKAAPMGAIPALDPATGMPPIATGPTEFSRRGALAANQGQPGGALPRTGNLRGNTFRGGSSSWGPPPPP
jgi:hypothetical protein